MTAVDRAFAAYDEALNLNPAERSRAQARHQQIRGVLSRAGLIAGSFLQGSFARKTMLKPLKDVDIICLLTEEDREQLSAPGGPSKALDMFRDAVAVHWPQAGFDEELPPAGKALRVSFPDCSFTVDLVAAFDSDSELVIIGDRDEDAWLPSTTRTLIRLIAARNQEADGRFVHQVRILRTLKHHHIALSEVAGIVFETLAYRAVTTRVPHQRAVAATLAYASTACRGAIYDPARENDLTEKWTPSQRAEVVTILSALDDLAREAIALEEAGDDLAALEIWHRVFDGDGGGGNGGGGEFPAPPPRSPQDVLTAWASGSLTSTGRPSTTSAGARPVAPGRGWLSA